MHKVTGKNQQYREKWIRGHNILGKTQSLKGRSQCSKFHGRVNASNARDEH